MRGDTGDVYWRRRMIVLVAVLVVVAVVAWACSSGDNGPQRASNAQSVTSSSPAADPLLAGLPTVTLSPSATASPKPTKAAGKAPSASATPKPRKPGEPCHENDLVLNLQGRQEIYAGGSRPNFQLTLVNTGPVMCTADVGPRSMEIRITSGSDRVWSTSDCVSGEDVEVKQMQRGIPYVRSLDWDRQRSSDDCQGKRPSALPGTYVAVVRAFGLRSPKSVFLLR